MPSKFLSSLGWSTWCRSASKVGSSAIASFAPNALPKLSSEFVEFVVLEEVIDWDDELSFEGESPVFD